MKPKDLQEEFIKSFDALLIRYNVSIVENPDEHNQLWFKSNDYDEDGDREIDIPVQIYFVNKFTVLTIN